MVKEVPDITDTPESEGQEGTAIDDDGVAGVALVEPTFGKVGVMPSHMELPPPWIVPVRTDASPPQSSSSSIADGYVNSDLLSSSHGSLDWTLGGNEGDAMRKSVSFEKGLVDLPNI